MADLSSKFQELFAKSDAMKHNRNEDFSNFGSPKIAIETGSPRSSSYQKSLYPEEAGRSIREKKIKAQEDYEEFVNSMTEDEVNSLMFLQNKKQIVIDKKVLKSMGEQGSSLGIERLEQNGLIKRELIQDDGLITFRLSTLGHRVMRDINL
jgi:hypothetical protein